MHTTCEQYAALISAAVDGALAPEERKDLMDHLAQCPACRETYTQMMLMHAAFDQWEEEPQGDLTASVMDQIHREQRAGRRHRRRWVQLGAAAACCALIVLGARVGQTLMPSAPSNVGLRGASPDVSTAADPDTAANAPVGDEENVPDDGGDTASQKTTQSGRLEDEDPSVETAITSFGTSPEDRDVTPDPYTAVPAAAVTLISSDQRLDEWMTLRCAEGEVSEDAETGATVTAWTVPFQQYTELETYLTEESIVYEVTGETDSLSEESNVRVVYLSISVNADMETGLTEEMPGTDE